MECNLLFLYHCYKNKLLRNATTCSSADATTIENNLLNGNAIIQSDYIIVLIKYQYPKLRGNFGALRPPWRSSTCWQRLANLLKLLPQYWHSYAWGGTPHVGLSSCVKSVTSQIAWFIQFGIAFFTNPKTMASDCSFDLHLLQWPPSKCSATELHSFLENAFRHKLDMSHYAVDALSYKVISILCCVIIPGLNHLAAVATCFCIALPVFVVAVPTYPTRRMSGGLVTAVLVWPQIVLIASLIILLRLNNLTTLVTR